MSARPLLTVPGGLGARGAQDVLVAVIPPADRYLCPAGFGWRGSGSVIAYGVGPGRLSCPAPSSPVSHGSPKEPI